MRPRVFGAAFALLSGASSAFAQDRPPNILLMIADDLGIEALSLYGLGHNTAVTPNIDRLAAQGVVFEQFWTQPTCTPSRSEMLTGRYGFHTGVTRQIGGPTNGDLPDPPAIPAGAPAESEIRIGPAFAALAFTSYKTWGPSRDEFTLPMALKTDIGTIYETAAIGKWHMGDSRNGWTDHPQIAGFDHYSGTFGGFPDGYFAWNKLIDGAWSVQDGYAPTDKVDDAISWIEGRSDAPWFLWLAFNAPHAPFHKPPTELLNSPELRALDPDADPADNPHAYFRAMVEAMDTEIGRLLNSIDPDVLQNTIVIFLGDNGTDRAAVSAPFSSDQGKGTVYNGGIAAPLIIAGPGIGAGRVSDGLVKTVDLYATIVEMSGRELDQTVPDGREVDSVSMVPYLSESSLPSIRAFNYTEYTPYSLRRNAGEYAIRDARYKYVVTRGREKLFDLSTDLGEQNNLLAGPLSPDAEAALASLKNEVSRMRPDL